MSQTAFDAVLDVMEAYFDGLYRADSVALQSVFHADLLYVNATEGRFETHSLDTYLHEIDRRISPMTRGENRAFNIGEVTLINDRMATVRASATMLARSYEDALTLIPTDDGWRIITKVFTFEELRS